MEKTIFSDESMAASKTFDKVLNYVKDSSLNFCLQLTPFSAVISLKKTFAVDKSGVPLRQALLNQPSQYEVKNVKHESDTRENELKLPLLEQELLNLREKYERLKTKYFEAHETIAILQNKVKDRDKSILDLEASNASATAAASKLNKTLAEKRLLYEREKNDIIKDYRGQVKSWRKELGQLTTKHINLQKKFDKLQTLDDSSFGLKTAATTRSDIIEVGSSTSDLDSCSLCSEAIINYIPEYFLGEVINPACDKCKLDAGLLIESGVLDPFSSFPIDEVPPSLLSHWIPPSSSRDSRPRSLLYLPSMRAHYVLLPNPGSSLVSMEEVLREFKTMMEKQRQEMRDSCKQS